MILKQLSNIDKSFIDNIIFDKINFEIKTKDKIAIIGKNGSGKTTLLNIIKEEIPFDSGQIYASNDLTISYLKQIITSNDINIYDYVKKAFKKAIEIEKELVVLEEKLKEYDEKTYLMYNSLLKDFELNDGLKMNSLITGILNGLGFSEKDYSRNINSLSGGEKNKLALAKVLATKADIIVLDEPTNHLDIKNIEWLENFLKQTEAAVIFVSHDRLFIDNICSKIIEIENKKLKVYPNNYSEYIKIKNENKIIEEKEYIKSQKEFNRQKEILRTFKERSLINSKFAKRAKDREKKIEKLDIKDKVFYDNVDMILDFKIDKQTGNDVIFLENIEKSFDKVLFKNVNLNIYKNDKIAILGDNGVGKTTLLNIIANSLKPDKGKIKYSKNIYIGYHKQNQEFINESHNLIEEINSENIDLNYSKIRQILAKFLFTNDHAFKQIKSLSGGEKARLNLLKLSLKNYNVLILDEPTNHLDIYSKEILEKALIDYKGTIICVSHDRYFVNKVINKKYYLYDKTINENPKIEKKEIVKKEKKIIKKVTKVKENIDYENKIYNLEIELEKLSIELNNPKLYNDNESYLNILNKYNKTKSEIELLFEKWSKNA